MPNNSHPFFKTTLGCFLSLVLLASWLAPSGLSQATRNASRKTSPGAQAITASAPSAVYVVNSTADPGTGTCDATECTLREAIAASNASVGTLDTINFQIGTGVQSIAPLSALPQITDPVIIDGTSQPGFAGTPIIELNGTSAGGTALVIKAGNSTIRGLVINRFGGGIGIDLKGSNVIEGNYIGTDVTGSVAMPNTGGGIGISNSDLMGFGQTSNRIGGSTPAQRNVISGNGGNAISLSGTLAQGATAGHVFQGNYIGVNASGNGALGNGGDGINISFNSSGSILNNVISGNGGNGVNVTGSNTGASISGNFIGTNFDGTLPIGNAKVGVTGFTARTQGLFIGGTNAASRNIISNNGMGGIIISCDNLSTCLVQGNYVGTDVTGNVAMGNNGVGVSSSGGSNSGVGGTATGAGNVISSNSGNGVTWNSSNIGGGFVQGNRIGTNASGTAALGNGQNGVVIIGNSYNATIGGTASGAGNTIAFNNGRGVVTNSFLQGHAILSNSIYANAGLGIDIWDNGITLNDNCDGGGSNLTSLQNFPVITMASSSGGSTNIQGTFNSTPNKTFTLQFFSSTSCDPSGYGEGETLIGSTTVTTDSSCVAAFNVTFPVAVSAGQAITSTATNSSNWSSEFSQCKLVDRLLITGAITTASGIPLVGVPVNLSGSQTGSTLTDSGGNYSFAVVPGGSYTVTPARGSLIFTPSSRTFNNISSDQIGANFTAHLRQPSDFDGDFKTDIAIWRPSTGDWDYFESTTGAFRKQVDWGRASLGDIPVPRDYDGDGRTDFAVWRTSEGNWYIVRSSNGAVQIENWGSGSNDVPAPADFDGDGKADVAVFRKTEGNWYIRHSSNGTTRVQGWGDPTDKLVPGDYDGDGLADIAVWRPSDGNWYIIRSATNTVRIQQWGISTDRPVPGDYDGDTKTDIAVFRPSDGNWYIIKSTGGVTIKNWGDPTDVPVPGDYDGDGRTDIAVFRPSINTWYIINSATNTSRVEGLGAPGDVTVPSMYVPQ